MMIITTKLPQTFEQYVKTSNDEVEVVVMDQEEMDAMTELWSNLVIIRSALSYKRKKRAQVDNDAYFHRDWSPNYPV